MQMRKRGMVGAQPFWNVRGTQRRQPVVQRRQGQDREKSDNERPTDTGKNARQTTARNCHAGGRGFESP